MTLAGKKMKEAEGRIVHNRSLLTHPRTHTHVHTHTHTQSTKHDAQESAVNLCPQTPSGHKRCEWFIARRPVARTTQNTHHTSSERRTNEIRQKDKLTLVSQLGKGTSLSDSQNHSCNKTMTVSSYHRSFQTYSFFLPFLLIVSYSR